MVYNQLLLFLKCKKVIFFRSSNIGIVIAIGSLGLFIGWLLEFSTALRFTYFSRRIDFNVSRRQAPQKSLSIINSILQHFLLILSFRFDLIIKQIQLLIWLILFCCSWQSIRSMFSNLIKVVKKRFRWYYLLLGFITLSLAGTCWKLETNANYWIWHRYETAFHLCFTSSVASHWYQN